ncbi:hypothetical protein G0D86_16580 [Burkholderia multivorans]|uniref:hypothetical protein n=1 Tax=Burkholderia multivorans TaxID=87883 RepID=UPI0019D0DF2E|nr:hypothetical protein [Burkholderia multivorans]QSL61241.1 hypothetical protein G0D86_16580 [Burkholderia multivorans]
MRIVGVRRSAFGVRRSAFGVRRSAFGVRRSAFGVRRSAFGVRRSAFGVRHQRHQQRQQQQQQQQRRRRHDAAPATIAGRAVAMLRDENSCRTAAVAKRAAGAPHRPGDAHCVRHTRHRSIGRGRPGIATRGTPAYDS